MGAFEVGLSQLATLDSCLKFYISDLQCNAGLKALYISKTSRRVQKLKVMSVLYFACERENWKSQMKVQFINVDYPSMPNPQLAEKTADMCTISPI